MEQKLISEWKYLLLALIAGLSGCASFVAIFYSATSFSIFPILSFVFSVNTLIDKNEAQPMAEGTPMLAFACFLVGIFGYSAFARMEAPEIGGNFISIIACMSLLIWIFFKSGWLSFDLRDNKDKSE